MCYSAKMFFTSKVSYYFFTTPPLKLKLGQQISWGVLIANHLDQSYILIHLVSQWVTRLAKGLLCFRELDAISKTVAIDSEWRFLGGPAWASWAQERSRPRRSGFDRGLCLCVFVIDIHGLQPGQLQTMRSASQMRLHKARWVGQTGLGSTHKTCRGASGLQYAYI